MHDHHDEGCHLSVLDGLSLKRKVAQNRSGFTLLELIIVMTIIGMISFLVPPLMTSTIQNLRFRTAARHIAASLRYARTQAVSEKTTFSFVFDFKTNSYWLLSKNIKKGSKKAKKLKLYTKKQISKEIKTQWIKDDGDDYSYSAASTTKGLLTINFFHNGNSSGGKIRVKKKGYQDKKENEKYYDIKIDPFTGSVQLEEVTEE